MKKKWIALGILEGILLIIFFIKAVSYQEVNIQIPQDDMRLYRTIDGEEVSEPSAYVDKSYEGGAFYIGPEIVNLDGGYYLVTVDYETNIESGCISTVTSPDSREASIRADEVPLIREKNQVSYRIYIRDNGLKVNIENREWSNQQDGWLLIKGISIRTYDGAQWYLFFRY